MNALPKEAEERISAIMDALPEGSDVSREYLEGLARGAISRQDLCLNRAQEFAARVNNSRPALIKEIAESYYLREVIQNMAKVQNGHFKREISRLEEEKATLELRIHAARAQLARESDE